VKICGAKSEFGFLTQIKFSVFIDNSLRGELPITFSQSFDCNPDGLQPGTDIIYLSACLNADLRDRKQRENWWIVTVYYGLIDCGLSPKDYSGFVPTFTIAG